MKALIVILTVLVVLFLLLQIPVGATAEYSAEGFFLWARAGLFRITIYPRPERHISPEKAAKKEARARRRAEKKKAKADDKSREAHGQERSPKRGGTVQLVLQLLPVICQALGALKRRICIQELMLDYTIAGGEDAAAAAILYGRVMAGEGVIVPLLENNFKVKRRKLTASVDFLAEQARVYLRAALTIRIGQILYLGIRYGLASLKVFLAHRKEQGTQGATEEKNLGVKAAPNQEKAV